MWLSWLERHPIHQKFVGSIPGQGACMNSGLEPQSSRTVEEINGCFSFSRWHANNKFYFFFSNLEGESMSLNFTLEL